ncbi:MAG: hypothetical protein WB919_03915, partial [Candidatus Sulfotelmatobacter sp.]
MTTIWLIALILTSAFAIVESDGWKWKLLNAFIILGCWAIGFGIGYAAGLGRGNLARAQDVSAPFGMMLGIVGAMVCI